MQAKLPECSLLRFLGELKTNGPIHMAGAAEGASNIIADMVEYFPTPTNYHYLGLLISLIATEHPEVKQVIDKDYGSCNICAALKSAIKD